MHEQDPPQNWMTYRLELKVLAADTFQLSVISEHCLTPKSFACQGQISFPELPTSSDKHMLWEYKAPLPHHHVGLPPENIQASVYLEHWLKPLLSLHHKPPSPLPNLAYFPSILME